MNKKKLDTKENEKNQLKLTEKKSIKTGIKLK